MPAIQLLTLVKGKGVSGAVQFLFTINGWWGSILFRRLRWFHQCEAAMFPSSSRCFHSRLLAWQLRSRYFCTGCNMYIAQPPQNAHWLATPTYTIWSWGPSHLPLLLHSNPIRNTLSIQNRAAAWHLSGPLGGRHTPSGASYTEGRTKWLNG